MSSAKEWLRAGRAVLRLGTTVARSLSSSTLPLLRLSPLVLALALAFLLATAVGTVAIPAGEVIRIVLYRIGLYAGHVSWPGYDEQIIWSVRLPRVLAAALVGAALATAGLLFQAVLRNPLADPYVIGTAAGAQLGVAIGLLLPLQLAVLGFGTIQVLAFAGALATVLFVYSLARTAGRTPVVTLLLAGFVISSFLISATSFLMMAGNHMTQVVMWTMGSMDASEITQLAVSGPLIVGGILAAWSVAPWLDLLLLGEEQAGYLGLRVEGVKIGAIALAALLTALAVTLAGIVAFVGLAVPHAMRLIYGPAHRILVPASALSGAIFLILADLAARTLLPPTEIPLGAVTAVIGAPLFLHLLRRSRRAYAL